LASGCEKWCWCRRGYFGRWRRGGYNVVFHLCWKEFQGHWWKGPCILNDSKLGCCINQLILFFMFKWGDFDNGKKSRLWGHNSNDCLILEALLSRPSLQTKIIFDHLGNLNTISWLVNLLEFTCYMFSFEYIIRQPMTQLLKNRHT